MLKDMKSATLAFGVLQVVNICCNFHTNFFGIIINEIYKQQLHLLVYQDQHDLHVKDGSKTASRNH